MLLDFVITHEVHAILKEMQFSSDLLSTKAIEYRNLRVPAT